MDSDARSKAEGIQLEYQKLFSMCLWSFVPFSPHAEKVIEENRKIFSTYHAEKSWDYSSNDQTVTNIRCSCSKLAMRAGLARVTEVRTNDARFGPCL